MRAYLLPQIEKKFADTLTDSNGQRFKIVPASAPNAVGIRPPHETYYYKKIIKKDKCLIHHTAGSLFSDIGQLTQLNNHVSTAYVIARNGTAYELFNPAYYSYHLGSGATGGNTAQSERSIAIEISNLGQLHEQPDQPNVLLDSYNKPYCLKSDKQYYMEKEYRGHKYWATYTEEQYKTVDSLLLYLCREFKIQHSFLSEDQRPLYQAKLPKVGILSHVNFRKDKTDLSPAFDYSKITGH